MAIKVTPGRTKMLVLRTLSLSNHWKLETWAKDMHLGKEEAAEKILQDFLKKVKLDDAA
jgi:hypothetical protein